jgi:hypothetical protein
MPALARTGLPSGGIEIDLIRNPCSGGGLSDSLSFAKHNRAWKSPDTVIGVEREGWDTIGAGMERRRGTNNDQAIP